ncbi:membrane protein insertase YidC [Phenylobacterium montanum]|uniref:Membrane protein insertase YidC n=1 Tax=Phenylobacterium montanum TaxID=2823693 RepID=A0A975FYS5_9CAUL|nr:membrane protein insertase YidC [Caulobacter sp. S6]QUD87664.1 membrane protein insertase YidC [Caulobacter sp. S6]
MDNESNRNTIIFVICAVVILGLYQFFYMGPQQKLRAQQQAQAAAAAAAHKAAATPTSLTAPGAPGFAAKAAPAAAPRIKIDTPSLTGSLSLQGARIDDLALKHYHTDPNPKSPLVQLLRPGGAQPGWFVQTGWLPGSAPEALPNEDAITWTAPAGAVLTPQTPLVLTYDNGQGLKAVRTIAVDDNAMFTVTDQIANSTAQPLSIRSYGVVEQQGLPTTDLTNSNIVHEGAIGVLSGDVLREAKYKDWKKKGFADLSSKGGWLGITEKYWLAALIPDQSLQFDAKFPVEQADGVDLYKSGYVGPVETVAAGQTLTRTTHVFAGAKTVPVLKAYSAKLGIPKFDSAVDWGMFWFFTQPLFQLLEFLKGYIGNIGLSILALTVIVKAVFFPLANKSYESMSKMKKIQPLVEGLKKQYGDDQAKLQQETMALYQREKINPFMGCLPMLIQIPVFYSLYKVLTVTIEMRQAPFFGWIQDLSAKDPTTVWNLFGAIPWDPSHAPLIGTLLATSLHLGVWPLLYGFSMWLSQAMSPPAGVDPAQKMMFQLMPIMFTFIMAQFTVGLLIYWCWNNVLSILQQYVIMHRLKVENPIDSFFGAFAKPRPAG